VPTLLHEHSEDDIQREILSQPRQNNIMLDRILGLPAAEGEEKSPGPNTQFNPMEVYVDQKEGVSLTHEDEGKIRYSVFIAWQFLGYLTLSADYKSLSPEHYTRILVGESTQANVYPLTLAVTTYIGQHIELKVDTIEVKVIENNDGTVSMKCMSNNKYATWYGACPYGSCPHLICIEDGICPRCKFSLTVGSITDIRLTIVDIKFLDGNAISKTPSQVAEDSTVNQSNTTMKTTLSVQYNSEKTETTNWEHAWGFALSVSAKVEAKIPFVGGGEVTTKASLSYNGKYGTASTKKSAEIFKTTKSVDCPPRTSCTLKYVAYKLDNYKIPFTATVERTQDEGPPIQMEQNGTWYGVQAFKFHTIYSTTHIDTGVSSSPIIDWLE